VLETMLGAVAGPRFYLTFYITMAANEETLEVGYQWAEAPAFRCSRVALCGVVSGAPFGKMVARERDTHGLRQAPGWSANDSSHDGDDVVDFR
jgi:hypothetical protein